MEEKKTLSFSIDSILSSDNKRRVVPKFSPYFEERCSTASMQPDYGTAALDDRIRQSLGMLFLHFFFSSNSRRIKIMPPNVNIIIYKNFLSVVLPS